MFKIDKLIMQSTHGEKYVYKFENGINYFRGKNNTGKTEFYKFIDYMFGSSLEIGSELWYKDSLKKATMEITYNNITYVLTRTLKSDINYFRYKDEEERQEYISLEEYKDKLNSIFAADEKLLKDIRNFTDENLTYRSFTMFNFLGETRQGVLNDFFDKCKEPKYSVKLNPILNFVFNKNLEEIFELKKKLEKLTIEVKELENEVNRFGFICGHVNDNLRKINLSIVYNGKNGEAIKEQLRTIKDMNSVENISNKEKRISELEVIYNNIDEQIKIYENTIQDSRRMDVESKNRKLLLQKLNSLIENTEFNYLVEPLIALLMDLENSISFNKYLIKDNTVKNLKKQRQDIKSEIQYNDYRFKIFNINEKAKAIAIIEDYLNEDINCNNKELNEKKSEIKKIKERIKVLQNSNDVNKVMNLSDFITELYVSTKDISDLVSKDLKMNGFKIEYFIKGNTLQPVVKNKDDEEKEENYYTGSMARHTLMQLCGYLGFLDLLISENRYPLIPILVIDHISKPFDLQNKKAIGKVFKKAYEKIGKENLQTFIFDYESNDDLLVEADHYENLITDYKTGFNPFFKQL